MWFIQGVAGFLLTIGTILVLRAAWKADATPVPVPAQPSSRHGLESRLDESSRRAA